MEDVPTIQGLTRASVTALAPLDRRDLRRRPTYPAGRHCPRCNAHLGRDNAGPRCSPCDDGDRGIELTELVDAVRSGEFDDVMAEAVDELLPKYQTRRAA